MKKLLFICPQFPQLEGSLMWQVQPAIHRGQKSMAEGNSNCSGVFFGTHRPI